MKKYSSVIAWAAIVLIMAVFALVMVLSDDEGSSLERDDTYYIQEYAVRYEHESGRSFRVTEEITAVFNQPGKHGIIRDLPYNSGEGYAGISSDDVFDVQTSSSFISVYLGDPYATVPRGEPVTYSLEYTFKLPSSAGKETVYINLVGAGWTTDIRSAACTLVLPEAPENILINDEDFTGGYTVNGNEVTVTAKGLSAFTPVTLRCSLDKGALGGYAVNIGTSFVISALLLIFGLELGMSPNNQAIMTEAAVDYRRMAVMVIVMAPVVEEPLFRGLLFGCIRPRSRVWAYVVSCLLFSLYHVWQYVLIYGDWRMLIYCLLYLPASIGLAWAYDRSGSIWGAIILHGMVNGISLSVLSSGLLGY